MSLNPLNPPSNSTHLLIAGGGTGGHILAGVAIADQWKKKVGEQARILFVGAQGGLEERLVPKSGYSLEVLRIGTLNRVSLSQRLRTLIQLPFSFIRSAQILLRFKPDYILGVGGYSSGPLVLTGKILKSFRLLSAQIAILEQNSIPGLTNRILGKFSDVIFAAFPGTEKHFPGKKVIMTGNPIRSRLLNIPSSAFTSSLSSSSLSSSISSMPPFTLFIFGGSQGAQGINSLVLAALPFLKKYQTQLKIIHQTGPKDLERVRQGYLKEEWRTGVQIEAFIDQMAEVYTQSSLLVCRAGSSTLSEVAAVGRAAIFIPLPTAADQHQLLNAQVFTKAGAGFLLSQTTSSGKDLASLIESLMKDPIQLRQVEEKVRGFSRPEAAMELVENFIQQK